MFNVITGFLKPDSGSVGYNGRRVLGIPPHRVTRLKIARTFQESRLISRMTVLDNVLLSFPAQTGESVMGGFALWPRVNRQERENRVEAGRLLDYVGMLEKADDRAENLSFGQQKLLALTCCLAAGGELLLLDEPVAGVAPAMVERILDLIVDLRKRDKTIILIEHNFSAVTAVCDRVIFMDEGRKIADGTPDEIKNNEEVIESYLT